MTEKPRIYREERIASSINGVGKTGQPQAKNETILNLTPYTKINSKMD